MAASAITNLLSSMDIHQFLKIYQMNGFTRNLNEDSEMWGYIKQLSEMDAMARSVKFLLIDELGYGAVQAVPADGSGAYPTAQRSGLVEPEALYKEWAWTVDVPRVLENKTGAELMQYAKPFATELDNKQIAFARLKCVEIQGDGSGTIGRISVTPTYAANRVTLTIDSTTAYAGKSFIRWFQDGDLVKIASDTGTARVGENSSGNYVTHWKVESVDDAAGTVSLSGYTASTGAITAVGVGTLASGDYVYRSGITPNDISSIAIDYAKLSNQMVGLESLTASDGRTVHGLTMSGALAGTRSDLNGAVIDSKHFQRILSKLKRKSGKSRFKYEKAFMADETYDSIVESRETDRRFHSIEDSDRGVKGVGYVHGKDRVEFVPDEFVHTQRIWLPPSGKEALCYIGKEAKQVKPNGNDPFHLSIASATSYGRSMQTFFEQAGVLVSKMPRAIGVIEDFTAAP